MNSSAGNFGNSGEGGRVRIINDGGRLGDQADGGVSRSRGCRGKHLFDGGGDLRGGRVHLGDGSDARRNSLELEAGATEHRPTLCGLERNSGLDAAGRTLGSGFGARKWKSDGPVSSSCPAQAGAFGLTELAALGVVFELLVVEEELLACGKDELVATVRALQNAVREFHCAFSHLTG